MLQTQTGSNSTILILLLATVTAVLTAKNSAGFSLTLLSLLSVFAFFALQIEPLLLFWLAASSVANYFIRYPWLQAVVTFDRVIISFLAISLVIQTLKNPKASISLSYFELFWLTLTAITLIDTFTRGFTPQSLKLAVDVYLLPILLFIVTKNSIHIAKYRFKLFTILISLAYLLPIIGIYEFCTEIDLFSYPGSDLMRDAVVRPNGFFQADNSFAVISLLILVALIYWPRLFRVEIKNRFFWFLAIFSALLASLLPQFRAVAITAGLCLLISLLLLRGIKKSVRPLIIASLLVMLFLPLYSVLRSSSFFQNRIANTTNAYSRVETYKVAIEVIKSNFLFGVGLGKYEDYFYQHHAPRKYASTQEELKKLPQSTPHNNLLAVMSEMGIIGAVPYLLSLFAVFVFSISMIRRGGEERTLGAAIFTLWLAYTLVGMTLTSGYYSDVNLILFFFSALFLRSKELKLGVKDEPVEKMEA